MYRVFLADDEVWEMKAMKKIIQQMELPILVDGEAEDGISAWKELLEKKPDPVDRHPDAGPYRIGISEENPAGRDEYKGGFYQWICRFFLCAEGIADGSVRLSVKACGGGGTKGNIGRTDELRRIPAVPAGKREQRHCPKKKRKPAPIRIRR